MGDRLGILGAVGFLQVFSPFSSCRVTFWNLFDKSRANICRIFFAGAIFFKLLPKPFLRTSVNTKLKNRFARIWMIKRTYFKLFPIKWYTTQKTAVFVMTFFVEGQAIINDSASKSQNLLHAQNKLSFSSSWLSKVSSFRQETYRIYYRNDPVKYNLSLDRKM